MAVGDLRKTRLPRWLGPVVRRYPEEGAALRGHNVDNPTTCNLHFCVHVRTLALTWHYIGRLLVPLPPPLAAAMGVQIRVPSSDVQRDVRGVQGFALRHVFLGGKRRPQTQTPQKGEIKTFGYFC